jgi:hypothetical protein
MFAAQLVARTKRPLKPGLREPLWKRALMPLLLPFILLSGLLLMAIIGIGRLLVMSFRRKSSFQDRPGGGTSEWSDFLVVGPVRIRRKWKGSLPWDSDDYYTVASEPSIAGLDGGCFGEWMFRSGEHLFLQRWDHPPKVQCTLLHVDGKGLRSTAILLDIPSKDWTLSTIDTESFLLEIQTSKEIIHYRIASQVSA